MSSGMPYLSRNMRRVSKAVTAASVEFLSCWEAVVHYFQARVEGLHGWEAQDLSHSLSSRRQMLGPHWGIAVQQEVVVRQSQLF